MGLRKINIPKRFEKALSRITWPVLEPGDCSCGQLTESTIGPIGEAKHCTVGWLNAIAKSVGGYKKGDSTYSPNKGTLRHFLFTELEKQLGQTYTDSSYFKTFNYDTQKEERSVTGDGMRLANWNDSSPAHKIAGELNRLGRRLGFTQKAPYTPASKPVHS